MKGSALLFMLFSWNLVFSLCTFCFTRLFLTERTNKKRRRTKKVD